MSTTCEKILLAETSHAVKIALNQLSVFSIWNIRAVF